MMAGLFDVHKALPTHQLNYFYVAKLNEVTRRPTDCCASATQVTIPEGNCGGCGVERAECGEGKILLGLPWHLPEPSRITAGTRPFLP